VAKELRVKILVERAAFHASILPKIKEQIIIEAGIYREREKPDANFDMDEFDPRDNNHCLFGQGFKGNGGHIGTLFAIADDNMKETRALMCRIPHPIWGNCTLLEIWAADHYTDYKDMVCEMFKYLSGETDEMPEFEIHFHPMIYYPEHVDRNARHAEREDLVMRGIALNMGVTGERYDELMAKRDAELEAKEAEEDDDEL